MRQRPVTLKIAGTDRSTYLVETSLEIETNIDDDFASAQFNLTDVDFDVGKLAAVLIHKPGDAGDKYFEGYATGKKRSHQAGERIDIALACDDYSRDLKYPEARLSATYANTSDVTIIGNALGTTNPSVNTTTNVTHQTTIGSIEFEDDDGWTIVRDVAARSGARWYIDFDQKLHYFSAASVSVSHTFTDAGAGGTRYDTFVEDVQPPQATKVVLTGAGTISTSASDAQIGGRHIVAHINDSDVTTAGDATDLANRKLDELGETAAYRITLRDSAPRAGERARLVNNEISVDSTLTIMRSRITIPRGASYVQNDVDLGRYIPRLTTEVAKDLSDIRGGGGGGSGQGGYAPRDHGHTGGADGPPLTTDAFDDTDPTSPITYWSTIEHYVDGDVTAATTIQADVKDDTLAFEELTAIDLVVSDDAEKIGIDMDGTIDGVAWPDGDAPDIDLIESTAIDILSEPASNQITFTMDGTLTAGATSSGGTLTANTAVGWGSGDAPSIGLTSSDSTITIEGDVTNKEIDFTVSAANLPYATPALSYGSAAEGSADTVIRSDATITPPNLGEIGDVTITTVADDEVLVYASGTWINQTLAEAGILADAYASITDGANTASASGSDTFKIRSSDSSISVTVADNDATHNDNVDLTVNTGSWAWYETITPDTGSDQVSEGAGDALTLAGGDALQTDGGVLDTDTVTFDVLVDDTTIQVNGSNQLEVLGGAGLPSGTDKYTLRYNGSAWANSGIIRNDGSTVSIGGNLDPQGSAILAIDGDISHPTGYTLAGTASVTYGAGASVHRGIYSKPDFDVGGAVSVDKIHSFYAANPSITSADTSSLIAYGLYIAHIGVGAKNYSIYAAGTSPSLFRGDVTFEENIILEDDDAELKLQPDSNATVGVGIDSPAMRLTSRYYNGASFDLSALLQNVATDTTNQESELQLSFPERSATTVWQIDEHGRQNAVGVGVAPAHMQDSGSWSDYNIHIGFGYARDSNDDTYGLAITEDGSDLDNVANANLYGIILGCGDNPGCSGSGYGGINYDFVTGILIKDITVGYDAGSVGVALDIEDVTASSGTAYAIRTGTGLVTFGDSVYFDEYLIHDGDPNTHIRFQVDEINLSAGGIEGITVQKGLANIKLGFFAGAASPIQQPTVSGARDNTEAALADLLTELANLGLITDSTTAT